MTDPTIERHADDGILVASAEPQDEKADARWVVTAGETPVSASIERHRSNGNYLTFFKACPPGVPGGYAFLPASAGDQAAIDFAVAFVRAWLPK
jgi:hypothetical protein